MTARIMVNAPVSAKVGEVVEVKTMIAHPMDTGYAVNARGEQIPRNIINRFVCTFEGDEIFSADIYPAIAANPFISFSLVATRTGTLTFTWTDDQGAVETSTFDLTVG